MSGSYRRSSIAALAALVLVVAGCGSASPSLSSSPTSTAPEPSVAAAVGATATPSGPESGAPDAPPTPEPSGFAFAAADVAAFFQSRGYSCSTGDPEAAGFVTRMCESTDDAGRQHRIVLTTSASGDLAHALASVTGAQNETILQPVDALPDLGGFLGATLGSGRGGELLTWLAQHLGDASVETTVGPLTVTTHTASADDHRTLVVEVRDPAVLPE